jgi:two-component system response regulator VicR
LTIADTIMKTILIIDDEREMLTLLEYLFEQLNYRVHIASKKIPLLAVRELSPDMVLLDNKLGKEFGGDLCVEIKSDLATHHIPVVMLSADEKIAEIARDSHADAWLSKPFDIDRLNKLVNLVLVNGKN